MLLPDETRAILGRLYGEVSRNADSPRLLAATIEHEADEVTAAIEDGRLVILVQSGRDVSKAHWVFLNVDDIRVLREAHNYLYHLEPED